MEMIGPVRTLWEESPIDSEYESFALTCEGTAKSKHQIQCRGEEEVLTSMHYMQINSDGNDDAHVLLSDLSPDSEIREFAKTCGGRGGDCSSFGLAIFDPLAPSTYITNSYGCNACNGQRDKQQEYSHTQNVTFVTVL